MTNIYMYIYLAQLFLEREMFQTKVVDKIERHNLCSVTLFSENRSVYKIMRKNTVQPDRPQMTIWCMR